MKIIIQNNICVIDNNQLANNIPLRSQIPNNTLFNQKFNF